MHFCPHSNSSIIFVILLLLISRLLEDEDQFCSESEYPKNSFKNHFWTHLLFLVTTTIEFTNFCSCSLLLLHFEKMRTLILVGHDGKSVPVEPPVASLSSLIRHMLERHPDISEIPVPRVNGKILERVVEWATHYYNDLRVWIKTINIFLQ